MKEITKAQEEILKTLWEIKEGAVSDILDRLPEPKPAYTTVATVVKVLEKKEYVGHKTFGKTHVYFSRISKQDYAKAVVRNTVKGLFNGSFNQLISSFFNEKNLTISELEDLRKLIDQEIKKKTTPSD